MREAAHATATTGLPAEGDTRCCYYSPTVLQHERELFRHYSAKDLTNLLEEMHLRLVGLVKLMKSIHADVRVKGHVINSLGCLLEQALSLALRMNHLYARVERVKEPVPCCTVTLISLQVGGTRHLTPPTQQSDKIG